MKCKGCRGASRVIRKLKNKVIEKEKPTNKNVKIVPLNKSAIRIRKERKR